MTKKAPPSLLTLMATALLSLAFSGCGKHSAQAADPVKAAPDSSQSADPKESENPQANQTDDFNMPTEEELKAKLTPLQYKVTRDEGTEPAFKNEYWDNKKPGIYVDVISGRPLFSSTHKYESGSGWPSFWQPIDKEEIVEKVDRKLFMTRTEVRSKTADSHLGHLFDDGPKPSGMRYCMNSASMRFVPKEKLEEEGLGEYLALFEVDKKGDD
jgi:methionine-R-sulfoxide reductase